MTFVKKKNAYSIGILKLNKYHNLTNVKADQGHSIRQHAFFFFFYLTNLKVAVIFEAV